jgi:hypothetical protein
MDQIMPYSESGVNRIRKVKHKFFSDTEQKAPNVGALAVFYEPFDKSLRYLESGSAAISRAAFMIFSYSLRSFSLTG